MSEGHFIKESVGVVKIVTKLPRPGARKNRPRFESGHIWGLAGIASILRRGACKKGPKSESGRGSAFVGTGSNHYQSGVHPLGNVVKPGSTSVPELRGWVQPPLGPLPFGAWFKT